MTWFEITAILLTLTALLSYLTAKFIRLPTTIGLMLTSLLLGVTLIILKACGVEAVEAEAKSIFDRIDFSDLLLNAMLSFLLFAGALHVNLDDLFERRWIIGIFTTLGVIASTFLVGFGLWGLSGLFHWGLPLIACLLFGALISPTDPIAVLAIMKKAGAPKSIMTKLAGESLFNDGMGVVVFLLLLESVKPDEHTGIGHIIWLFAEEALGGILLGLILGLLAFYLLKSIDHYQAEVLITLALVTGGYALAHRLNTSGPIAMVVAGLLIGNHGRRLAMSDHTRGHLDDFWELVDAILNAMLFVLIGLEVLVLSPSTKHVLAGLIAIPLVLLVRWICVAGPITLLRRWRTFHKRAIPILTWGGLRGGIAVALALSLSENASYRPFILTITYCVVAFSILVQGSTTKYLIPHIDRSAGDT
ncbi:MAG: sodium:proton antiporter [Sedimentisphaerales bacterium]|nr:sodium:proton antiporter [Sedimentisphaerales bacterium]